MIFDWSKIRFDWSKITFDWSNSDRVGQIQNKILIAFSIGRETDSIDRKSGKHNFLKTEQFYVETPQSIVFYEKNAWVWDEMLFKNTCFKPSFPKNKIFNQLSLNSQTSNTFRINIKEFSILDGQNKITHNNMYKV